MKRMTILSIILLTGLIHTSWGAIPRTMNYQGVLNDAGSPANGSYGILFTIYDENSNPVWSEDLSVPVTEGIFSVVLGETTPLPDPFPDNAKLGINVAAMGELTPRTLLTTTPYSLTAAKAENSDSLGHVAASSWTLDNEVGPIILANDGSGSGLDADLLDGQSSLFYRDAGSIISGELGSAYFDAFTNLANNGRFNYDSDTDILNLGEGNNRYWRLGGNSLTTTGIFGASTNYAIDFRVNNARVLRLEPNGTSPNIIGGYSGNTATAGIRGATIGGGGYSGYTNQVSDYYGTVSGGAGNSASSDYATVGGGYRNTASGMHSTIGGGDNNTASAQETVVGGGDGNTASGVGAAIGGGASNTASNSYAAIPGGVYNEAAGQGSFAAGSNAHALHNGAVVIAATTDWTPTASYAVYSGGTEQMVLRADGGLFITNQAQTAAYNTSRLINTSSGAYLTTGGTWTNYSDRSKKENFSSVDGAELLDKVAELPITRWNYKAESDDIQHIGPTAQDFHTAFGLGDSDKAIATIDEGGVALAGIQELYRRSQEKTQRISELEAEVAELRMKVEALLAESSSDAAAGRTAGGR